MKSWSNAIELPITCSLLDNVVKLCHKTLELTEILALYAVVVVLFHQSGSH